MANVQSTGVSSKKNGQRNERSFQDAVGTVLISVAEAAGEDDPSKNKQQTGHG